jgi:protein gp37
LQTVYCQIALIDDAKIDKILKSSDFAILKRYMKKNAPRCIARPMKPEWALNVKRQCEEPYVAFFFKQWGAWGMDGVKRSKKSNGRLLEGQEWNGYPEIIDYI